MSTSRRSSEHVPETGKIDIRAEGDVQGIFATGDVNITDSEISIGQRITNTFIGGLAQRREQCNRQTILEMVKSFWVKRVCFGTVPTRSGYDPIGYAETGRCC